MNFNVCILQPPGYVYARAFDEIAALVAHGLRDLGHTVTQGLNRIDAQARNVIFGAHLLSPANLRQPLPPHTVFVNTEQVHKDDLPWNAHIFHWARLHPFWDYSARNIDKLREEGALRVSHLGVGHHPGLATIRPAPLQDIDVLFYGELSDRRRAILQAVADRGLRVETLYQVYGAERDAYIARAKVVLNLHQMNSKIFEVVRVFYLMSNAKAVVAEVGPDTAMDPFYRAGICCADESRIADECLRLVRDDTARAALEAAALATISARPQHELMRPLVPVVPPAPPAPKVQFQFKLPTR